MPTPEELRKCERISSAGSFRYALSVPDFWEPRQVEAEGIIIDICRHSRGIGFYTSFPLEQGHVLRLLNGTGVQKPAVVKWVEKAGEKHRAGIYIFG